ncbi:glutamate-rich protein 3 isoform X1 [Arapaima gigas]
MSHLNPGLLSAYNSLTDKHLAGYFNNTRIRRHLVKVGLITRSGNIVPDKEYKYNVMRRYHERHMRECLAQAIFNKVLDIERHHQTQIKRKLEDFAQRERVNKIKVEHSRRCNGDVIPLRSPRPPSGPRNGQTWHSGPEVEQSESSESPGSSRPNTAPEKIQRPVRLQPIHSGSTHRPSQSSSPRASSGDKEQLDSNVLDRDGVRHVTVGKFSTGISPYRLPVINNFITPVPPPSKRKARSFKSAPNESMRGRKLRPTTAPSVPVVTKESIFHKTSVHSNVSITMVLCCKMVNLSHNDIDLRHEVKVFQQHCGGENICVYKGKLREGDCFRFISRRHRGFPFSLTFYLNSMQVERLSSCCEFRYRRGSRLGGKRGHFSFVSVDGASPCYRCIIAMGLDKKPTPPPKGKEQDTDGEGFFSSSLEMAEDTRDKGEETVRQECLSNIEAESAQGHADGDHKDPEANDTIHEVQNDKGKDGYDEDFEADDERVDDEKEECEPHTMNTQCPSPSNEERDSHSESEENREDDSQESDDDEKGTYTDTEAEEDNTREKAPSVSSRSASFSSDSNEDSGSEAADVKEVMTDRASSCVSRGESAEEDKTGQEVEEHIQLEQDDPGQGSLKEVKASEETMEPASADNDEAIFDAKIQTTTTVEEERVEPQDSALDRPKEEDSLSNVQTGMAGGVASEYTETDPKEIVEEAKHERAKSVQEKLAEAIMKETQCDSEPELSDTSTEEEEDQNCIGSVELQENAPVSLPQSPYTKVEISDEQSIQAEAESPAENFGDKINANFMEKQEAGDTQELPHDEQQPTFERQREETEEMSTETELQEQRSLSIVLDNSEELVKENRNNVEEKKMEMAAKETGEWETEGSGEAHTEATQCNFSGVDEFKTEESKNKAKENETRTEDTENGGVPTPEETSNVYKDVGKSQDDLITLKADQTEDHKTCASENLGSNDTEKRESIQEPAEGGAADPDEKDNDTIGQIDEMTDTMTNAEPEANTEDADNLDKLNTIEHGDEHTEQEEKHDAIQHNEADIGEEHDKLNVAKTNAPENQVVEENINNKDMEVLSEKNNEATEEPVGEVDTIVEKERIPIGIQVVPEEQVSTDQPTILEEQKELDYEDKTQSLFKMKPVEIEAKNEEGEEMAGNVELKAKESEPEKLESKENVDVEQQVELENNIEFVDKNMDSGLERESEAVSKTETHSQVQAQLTVSEGENSRSSLTETVVKSDEEKEDKDETEEFGGKNVDELLEADENQSRTEDKAEQAQDIESNEGDKEREAEETMSGSIAAEIAAMQITNTEEQMETKEEKDIEEGIETVSVTSGYNTEISRNDTNEIGQHQKLQNESNTAPEASMENENEQTMASTEKCETTKHPPEGNNDDINNPGLTEGADEDITETKSELKAQDEQHDQVQPLKESEPDNLLDKELAGMEPKVTENKEDESKANVEEYCMADGTAESLSDTTENRVEISEPTVAEGQNMSNETKSSEVEIEGKVNESDYNGYNDISEGDVKADQDEKTTDIPRTLNVIAHSADQIITIDSQSPQPEALMCEGKFNTTAEENQEAIVEEGGNDLVTNLEEKRTETVIELPGYEEQTLYGAKADSQTLATEVRDGDDTSELRSSHSKDEETRGLRATQGMSDGEGEPSVESKLEDQSKDEVQNSVPHSTSG